MLPETKKLEKEWKTGGAPKSVGEHSESEEFAEIADKNIQDSGHIGMLHHLQLRTIGINNVCFPYLREE